MGQLLDALRDDQRYSLSLRRIGVGPGFGAGPQGSKRVPIYQLEAQRPVGVTGGVGRGGIRRLDQGRGDPGEAGQGRRLDLHHVGCVTVEIVARLREDEADASANPTSDFRTMVLRASGSLG